MKKIIIGIHGLRNKPPRDLLARWWRSSIMDGIQLLGKKIGLTFELVYWANFNYEEPLSPLINSEKSDLFIREPYYKPVPDVDDEISLHKKRFLDKLEKDLDKILLGESGFSGWDKLADLSIKYMFKDLDNYYHNECRFCLGVSAKQMIRNELRKSLQKHNGYKICLIAHSMGSIIAYDVLRQNPELKIHTFITLGSPLGIPIIIKKIMAEHALLRSNDQLPVTPDNITDNWFNFSDLDDNIAFNYTLGDDYLPNRSGINPVDVIVENHYQYNKIRNHHKIYGYLQTKAVAEAIYRFYNPSKK